MSSLTHELHRETDTDRRTDGRTHDPLLYILGQVLGVGRPTNTNTQTMWATALARLPLGINSSSQFRENGFHGLTK